MEVEDVIIWFQTLAHVVGRVERRRKPAHAGHNGLSKPVGNLLFTSDVEAGQEGDEAEQEVQDTYRRRTTEKYERPTSSYGTRQT